MVNIREYQENGVKVMKKFKQQKVALDNSVYKSKSEWIKLVLLKKKVINILR